MMMDDLTPEPVRLELLNVKHVRNTATMSGRTDYQYVYDDQRLCSLCHFITCTSLVPMSELIKVPGHRSLVSVCTTPSDVT